VLAVKLEKDRLKEGASTQVLHSRVSLTLALL
jgi:hypothetical protein